MLVRVLVWTQSRTRSEGSFPYNVSCAALAAESLSVQSGRGDLKHCAVQANSDPHYTLKLRTLLQQGMSSFLSLRLLPDCIKVRTIPVLSESCQQHSIKLLRHTHILSLVSLLCI